MEDAVRQRIKDVLHFYKLTQNALAGEDRPLQKRLSRQLNGTASIDFSTLATIITRFPNVSLEWLFRGKGSMFIEEADCVVNSNTISKQNAHNINNGPGSINNTTDNDVVLRLLEQNAALIEILKNK